MQPAKFRPPGSLNLYRADHRWPWMAKPSATRKGRAFASFSSVLHRCMLGHLWEQPGRSIRPIATSVVIWRCRGASPDSNLIEAGTLRLRYGSLSAIDWFVDSPLPTIHTRESRRVCFGTPCGARAGRAPSDTTRQSGGISGSVIVGEGGRVGQKSLRMTDAELLRGAV